VRAIKRRYEECEDTKGVIIIVHRRRSDNTIIAHITTYQVKRHLSGFSSKLITNVPYNNVLYILTKNRKNFSFVINEHFSEQS
jgi:hypothetical protein